MKEQREAWWAEVNWDHLDALTACEAWDAAERAHAAALAAKDADIEFQRKHIETLNRSLIKSVENRKAAEARAERAEAYVGAESLRSDYRTAADMRAALDECKTHRDALRAAIETALQRLGGNGMGEWPAARTLRAALAGSTS